MDTSKTPAQTTTDAIDTFTALIDHARQHLLRGEVRETLAILDHIGNGKSAEPLPPPAPPEAAPAPRVRIRTLGAFSVTIDEQPLRTGRKLPRRPLELLKAIVVFGGRQIPQDTLADVLWPEFDGDRAHNALTTALHRLRYLLRVPNALVVCDGRVSLNPARVNVDAFDANAVMRDLSTSGPAWSPPIETLLALYRGPFLPDEAHVAWTERMRDRLRQRFSGCIAAAAASLERAGRVGEAHALYRREVAIDDCAPRLHDGLLRCAGLVENTLPPARRLRPLRSGAFTGVAAGRD